MGWTVGNSRLRALTGSRGSTGMAVAVSHSSPHQEPQPPPARNSQSSLHAREKEPCARKIPAKGLWSSVAPWCRDRNCCKWGKSHREGRRCSDTAALLDLGGSTGYSTLHVRVEVSSWGINAGKEQTVISPLYLPCTN